MQIHGFPRGFLSEDDSRRVHEFLNTAPKEVLVEVNRLLEMIFGAPNSEVSSIYYIGMVTTLLGVKYDSCACGVNHDQEALDRAARDLAEGKPAEDGNFVRSAFFAPTGGVVPLSIEPGTGRVRCDGELDGAPCGAIFKDIQERFMQNGIACPKCGAGG